jgi:hypothetical protein
LEITPPKHNEPPKTQGPKVVDTEAKEGRIRIYQKEGRHPRCCRRSTRARSWEHALWRAANVHARQSGEQPPALRFIQAKNSMVFEAIRRSGEYPCFETNPSKNCMVLKPYAAQESDPALRQPQQKLYGIETTRRSGECPCFEITPAKEVLCAETHILGCLRGGGGPEVR